MEHHFTWFDFLHVGHEMVPVYGSIVVTGLIILLSIAGRMALGNGEASVQPAGSLTLKGFFEAITEFINGMLHGVMGDRGKIYIPLFGAMFFYIILSNLLGLVPGFPGTTADLNTTLAIGAFSFVMYNVIGIAHGGWHYLAHFLGPVWWLAWLLLPIELISHLVRPMTLGIRLSVNMKADHAILGTFIDLTKVIVPVIFYGMGTFVSFIQAFVFTLLSMVYVTMATADEH